MNLQLTLAWRYLNGRRLRTFLTTLAIIFGVLVIFGMNTIMPAFSQAFSANLLAAAGQVDVTITHRTSEAFAPQALEKVAALDGVRAAAGLIERTVNLPADYFDGDPSTPDRIAALTLKGLDPTQVTSVRAYQVTDGRFLHADDRAAAVISKSLAEAADVTLGDTLTLPTPTGLVELTIVGLMPVRAMPGNEEVFVTLPQAQAMLEMPGKINVIEANFDSLKEARRAEIEAALQAALGGDFQLQALASGAELLTNLRTGQVILNVLAVLALLMGGFIIFNTFRTIVAERKRDIGMLRAVGASRRSILGLILVEGLVQGIIGTAAGILFGYILGAFVLKLMSGMMSQFLNVKIGAPVVSAGLVALAILMGVGITVSAGLIPALRAARITPLEALRPSVGEISIKRMAGFGFWSGAAMMALSLAALFQKDISLIGPGFVLFTLGLVLTAPALVNPIANIFARLIALLFARQGTGHLAEGNISRQPGRAAVTASATMIGLAILVMAGTLMGSVSVGFLSILKKSLGSDYLLVPPSVAVWGTNVGAQPQLAEELRALDGVEAVSTMRFAAAQVETLPTPKSDGGATPVSVLGITPENYVKVSGLTFGEGEPEAAYAALEEGRNMIVNGVFSSATGKKLGDEVNLLTASGVKSYRIVGIGNDYLNAKIATLYISQANIAADFDRHEDVFLQINLTASADRAAAESAIKQALIPFPQFRLISGVDYYNENKRLFDAAFYGMYLMLIFLATPSLIAMLNTLAIGVIERTREIGMLRAVGATRKQVRTIILAEALILASLGTAFGLLSGLYLAYLAVQGLAAFGYPLVYTVSFSGTILAISIGLLFGALAAVIPARQAARMNVVEALRYE